MRKRYDNEILEEGQVIAVYKNQNKIYRETDGCGILRKKVYEKNNQQVWSMWWSAICDDVLAGFTQPEQIEPINQELECPNATLL